jgi:hypothetical protein
LVRSERFPETRNWRWSYKVSVRLPDGLSCFPIGRVIFFVHTGFHPAERLLDWSTTNSLYSALFIVPVHKVVMEPSETESQVYEVEFPVPALVIRHFSVHHQVAGVVFDYSGPVAVITSNAVRVDIPASDIPR